MPTKVYKRQKTEERAQVLSCQSPERIERGDLVVFVKDPSGAQAAEDEQETSKKRVCLAQFQLGMNHPWTQCLPFSGICY